MSFLNLNDNEQIETCRLCYRESENNVDIYSDIGSLYDCEKKINKYLYLQITKNDEYPKFLCLVCLQHLETFHKFYEKVHDIQKKYLKEKYDSIVLKAIYHNSTIILQHDIPVAQDTDVQYLPGAMLPKEIDSRVVLENLPQSQVLENLPEILTESETTEANENESQQDNNLNKLETNLIKKTNLLLKDQTLQIEQENLTKSISESGLVFEFQTNETKTNSQNLSTYLIKFLPGQMDELINKRSENYMKTRSKRNKILFTDETPQEVINLEEPDHQNGENEVEEEEDDDQHERDDEENNEKTNESKPDLNQSTSLGDECTEVEKKLVLVFQPEPETFSDGEEIQYTTFNSKRSRGRPKGVSNKRKSSSGTASSTSKVIATTSSTKNKNSGKCKKLSIPEFDDEDLEGESEDEFPARDSDNEDWPSLETLNKFPDRIIENGVLVVKGKKLMAMISKFYNLECEFCDRDKPRFRQLRQLFNHISEKHQQVGFVKCCQTKFSRYPGIIMHMARHLQPELFKCDICGYMVTRPRFLQTHKQTHLPEDEKPFACDQCPKKFCWKGALNIHKISHQPKNERKLYICYICGKYYDTPGGLSTHKKIIHSNRKQETNICHVCAKKFATRTGLNEHMATIHQPREKAQVQCTECGNWLMNQRCLKSHMILHSTVDYKCRNCDYKTKKPFLLKRHIQIQHSTAKPFLCSLCGKSFKIKRALSVHLAQHSAATKTYKCPFCEREFASSTNFYTHRKNMHPIEFQEMKKRKLEEQRQKRIQAGIEVDNRSELLDDDFSVPMSIQSLVNDDNNDDMVNDYDNLMPSVGCVMNESDC